MRRIIFGVKPWLMRLRRPVCLGASMLTIINSDPPTDSSMKTPWPDANDLWSVDVATTSSYLVTTQKPVPSVWGFQWTGSSFLSCLKVS